MLSINCGSFSTHHGRPLYEPANLSSCVTDFFIKNRPSRATRLTEVTWVCHVFLQEFEFRTEMLFVCWQDQK